MSLDFDKLRSDLKVACTAAVNELRAAHPDEHFYAFALYTDDGVAGVCAAANTDDGLARRIALYKLTNPGEINRLRWSTSEWKYEGFGWDHLKDTYHAIMAVKHPEDDDDAFPRFRRSVLDLMIEVLAAMDKEGAFGQGDDRERVTLLCSITDSDEETELLDRSIRLLNPRSVVAKYESSRID